MTRELLQLIVAAVPDAWVMGGAGSMSDPEDHRRAYVDYLMTRLESPRPFVAEADDARRS